MMRFIRVGLLLTLGLAAFPAFGELGEDLESVYALKLEKEADVVINYDDLIRIKAEAFALKTFDTEQAGFDYLASLKKRKSVVVILGKDLRATDKLGLVADNLEAKLKKLGFSIIVFELADAEGRPIYRIYKKG